jgi:hypothetical protein
MEALRPPFATADVHTAALMSAVRAGVVTREGVRPVQGKATHSTAAVVSVVPLRCGLGKASPRFLLLSPSPIASPFGLAMSPPQAVERLRDRVSPAVGVTRATVDPLPAVVDEMSNATTTTLRRCARGGLTACNDGLDAATTAADCLRCE